MIGSPHLDFYHKDQPNVGKYTIDGWYGDGRFGISSDLLAKRMYNCAISDEFDAIQILVPN